MKSFDPVNLSTRSVNKLTLKANIITLSGSTTNGHTANITINGNLNTSIVTVSGTSLTTTAAAWCAANYEFYKAKGFLVTSAAAVITVSPVHGWDSTNRIDATIATVAGGSTLTGTLTGTLTLDGSKAKVWEVVLTTPSVNFATPIGMTDASTIKIALTSTTSTTVTTSSLLYINGLSAITFTVDTTGPYIIDAFYDSITGRLVGQSNVLTTELLKDASVTAAKLAPALDLTAKDIRYAVKNTTPVNAVAAAGLLTLTGTVLDGETITVGSEIFEIDTDNVIVAGHIRINVAAFAVAARGTLTVTAGGTQIADGYTVTLGAKTYTFKTTLTAVEGQVLIGVSDTTALLNLKNAINHTGTPGTDYVCAAVHPTVTGVSSGALTLIVAAKTPGTIGNAIVSTKTGAQISWDGAGTLGTTVLGADCTAANADGVIVTDATAGSTVIAATQGGGTTVIFTKLVKGVAGNAVAFSTTLSHGGVDAALLGTAVVGVNGTVGIAFELRADATNLYMATAANTIADANWKKLVLQSI
jgi:hypothetical protein